LEVSIGANVEAPPLKRTLATLTDRRAIVDALIERSNWQIFGTAGDSVLAEFPSVVQAFGCAIAMQQSVHHANNGVPANQQMSFRIGINVADVMVRPSPLKCTLNPR
jgi:adenylate cyclase